MNKSTLLSYLKKTRRALHQTAASIKKKSRLICFMGTKNEAQNFTHPLYSCFFNLNEETLLTGVDFHTQVLAMMD